MIMAGSKFVYVIASNINRVKIGISANAEHRMAQIKAASPIKIELKLVFSWLLYPLDARACVRALHDQFAPYRLHGEWFSIDPGEAIQAACLMALQYPQWVPREEPKPSNRKYVKGGISLARKA